VDIVLVEASLSSINNSSAFVQLGNYVHNFKTQL